MYIYISDSHTLQDYTITSSWRQRHAAMTPLFAATQMSQTQGSGDAAMETDDVSGHVRATQDAAGFTPTLQEGGLVCCGVMS